MQHSRPAPAPIELKAGRLWHLGENIAWHFAGDGRFHKVPDMVATLDPLGTLELDVAAVLVALRAIGRRRGMRLETRPAAKGQKHYRIYREGPSIGLPVLQEKFRPVIEELEAQAELPISHQTSARFLHAANTLRQLLRDLEAE